MNKNYILIIIELILIIFLIYPSAVYLINNYFFEASAFFNFLVALATAAMCYLTYTSVDQVIKSNNENRDFNQKNINLEQNKFDNDVFEKRFSTLLGEHEYYLGQLLNNTNKFYSLSNILKLSGYESLLIIRGEVFFDIINNIKYAIYEDKLYMSIESVLSLHDLTNLQADHNHYENLKIIKSTLKKHHKSNHYICKNGYIYNDNHDGVMKLCNEINEKLGSRNIGIIADVIFKHMREKIKEKVSEQISLNNEISKNILSPYMRIIYHILKLAQEHASKTLDIKELGQLSKEMKKSTNIIRSMLPNNILALIAINSLFFYRNKFDDNGVFSSSKANKESIESKVFNDYKKYYNLLVMSDFFEHLYLEKNETYINYHSNFFLFDFDKNKSTVNKNDNYTAIVTEVELDKVIDYYYRISNLVYSNTTKELLYLFYIKNNSDHNKTIQENINLNIETFYIGNQLDVENKKYNNSHYIKDENKLILGSDFALKYADGELISGLKTESQCTT